MSEGGKKMMTKSISALLWGALTGLGLPAPALANGATASFPAGGVVFHHEKHISIVREDLELALDRVRVHYVFHSSAAHPLRLTIGFPLAKVVLNGGTDSLYGRSASTTNLRNYMAFKVKANGKAVRPKLHEYAWMDGINITQRLKALHVPIFAIGDDSDVFVGLQKLPRSTLDTLMKAKLVEQDSSGFSPLWNYQSVYEWRQSFPPGESKVDITYVPLTGDNSAANVTYAGLLGKGGAGHCFDDDSMAHLKEGQKEDIFTEPLTLDYILMTARNWNGPIGFFRLTVKNPDHYPFSFCAPNGLKPTGGSLTWEARDFVPQSNLQLVFFPGNKL
jgi:hypothetical protein